MFMKWIKWGLVVVMLVAAIVVFSTKIFQKKYTFYYYPEWNAYYDLRNKNYIYSIDGGKSWDTITNTSNTLAQTLGRRIVIRSNSTDIWMNNAEHRTLYGGKLNDLVSNFLQTEQDKTITKRNLNKDSTLHSNTKADSLLENDSSKEIENWVKETTPNENGSTDKKIEEEKNASATNSETQSSADNDDTATKESQ